MRLPGGRTGAGRELTGREGPDYPSGSSEPQIRGGRQGPAPIQEKEKIP